MFERVLIANRGEIAVRIIRACRDLGIESIAVYSDSDRYAQHAQMADRAVHIGPTPAAASYLNIERLLIAADATNADAIHPGYGFLSENADFADAVTAAGIAFVGPSGDAMRVMGDKLSARAAAVDANVPVVPGTTEPLTAADEVVAFGREHGWPLAVKAAYGGGGRGMKVVPDEASAEDAFTSATRESVAAFGRGECYVERYLERPRHLEIQILGDTHGTVIHLAGRDCSLQRRHQKLVEEAPPPNVSKKVLSAMAESAVRMATSLGYAGAGTCEYLLDDDGETFYFLEMNTRLQVEHPVTECITGVDLVHEQLRVAAGQPLRLTQDDITVRGHAIELRINAEDVAAGFTPAPGRITRLDVPLGPGIRLDAGVREGDEIPQAYDSLIGKLIAHGATRDAARTQLLRAVDELVIEGVPTTIDFHELALRHPDFAAATHATSSVEHEWDLDQVERRTPPPRRTPLAAAPDDVIEVVTEVDGERVPVAVHGLRWTGPTLPPPILRTRRTAGAAAGEGAVVSPMHGAVVQLRVDEGDTVTAGQVVAVVEAMKMENPVLVAHDGEVRAVHVAPGDTVDAGTLLVEIAPHDA